VSAARRRTAQWDVLARQLYDLSGRVPGDAMTASELRRLVAVFTEAEDRIAGRKRQPARVLYLVPPA
jgi:hypothetical protein